MWKFSLRVHSLFPLEGRYCAQTTLVPVPGSGLLMKLLYVMAR